MPTYAIGDVQGCLQPLKKLLEKIAFNPSCDHLWFVGDLINRGPNSLETLQFIKKLQTAGHASVILGNHDLALLVIAAGFQSPQPGDTLDDILNAPDCKQYLDWLRQLPLIHHAPSLGFSMVHAGIPPQWTLAQAIELANEVTAVLKGPHATKLLAALYGNEPAGWDNACPPMSRYRYIVNALTRMRFCQADGTLNLTDKGSAAHPPTGFQPWYTWPSLAAKDTTLLFGHWAALQGQCPIPTIEALDTGCVWGHCLTAFCLENKLKISVNCGQI